MSANYLEAYRRLRLVPDAKLLDMRATAIDQFIAKADTKQCLEILRIYLGRNCSGIVADAFRAAFTNVDQSFPSGGNDFEMRVLSGLTLIEILDKGNDLSAAVALAIASVFGPLSAHGTRHFVSASAKVHPDLNHFAQAFLVRQGVIVRTTKNAPSGKDGSASVSKLINNLNSVMKKMADGSESQAVALTKINASVSELTGKHRTNSTQVEKDIRALTHNRLVFEEQSMVLWWLLKHNNNTEQHGSSIADAITAGEDFASCLRYVPVPLWGRAILHQFLQVHKIDTKELYKITDVSNGVTEEWRQEHTGRANVSAVTDLCPLAFFSTYPVASDLINAPIWLQQAYHTMYSLPDLAYQVVLERSLADAV